MLKFYVTAFSTIGAIYYGSSYLLAANPYAHIYIGIGLLATTVISAGVSYFAKDICKATFRNVQPSNDVQNLISELVDEPGNSKFIDFDLSKVEFFTYRSESANAFACGLTQSKAGIFVASALFEKFPSWRSQGSDDRRQIKAILAHECGHVCGAHAKFTLLAGSLVHLVRLLRDMIGNPFPSNNSQKTNSEDKSAAAKLMSFVALWVVDTFALSMMSRQMEYDADKFATKCDYGPDLIYALNKIDPHKHEPSSKLSATIHWVLECFSPHPTTINRAIAIETYLQCKDMSYSEGAWNSIKSHFKEWTSAFTEKRQAETIALHLRA